MTLEVRRVIPNEFFEAVHFNKDASVWDVARWCNAYRVDEKGTVMPTYCFFIRSDTEEKIHVERDQWIIKGINGVLAVVPDVTEYHLVKG